MKITINKNINLPEDSLPQILSLNILDDQCISMILGTQKRLLRAGDTIQFFQSSINIEGLRSQFILRLKDNNSSNTPNDSLFFDYNKSNDKNRIFNESKC